MSDTQATLHAYGGVFLTFDDGPDPEWTPRILQLLADADAKATFFVVGRVARQWPDLVRQAAAAGHEIGNHTYTHRHPWRLREADARAEVRDGAAAIADILGSRPSLYRPPHGAQRRCTDEEARAQRETCVMWDTSAIDWGLLGTAPRIARRLARVRPGDIVLMHDARNRRNRPDQLTQVLPQFLLIKQRIQ